MKFLLVALLCIAAAAAYAPEDDLEYALFEDAGILAGIRERIQKGFEAVLNRIKALIEEHKPLVANLKERFETLKEKVKELFTQTGQKFLEAIRSIRSNISQLLKDVLKKIGDGTAEVIDTALYESEDELTPFQQLIQRIKERIQAAWNRLIELVNKHKETISTTLKAKIDEIKTKLAELAKEHGAKLLDHAREIGLKIRDVLREVLGKIGQKEESALYAVQEEGETFLQALKRRIIERLQNYVQQIQDKLKQVHGDFVEKVLPKIQEIKDKIKELTSQSGEKLLEIAGQISEKIRQVLADLKEKILGGVSLYADEEEVSDPSIVQLLIKRLQERLQTFLEKAKALISKHKEIAGVFKEKIQEIAEKIKELAKEHGAKLRDHAREIGSKIRELLKQVLEKIGITSYYMDIHQAAKTLKEFFITDAGIAALKDNAAKASPNTQTGILIKAFILAATPDALKELIRELFKNIKAYAPISQYEDIRELVKKAAQWLQTDEGVSKIREYAKSLDTAHPVVLRLKAMLEDANDAEVKSLMRDIFTIN